jgi:hypothetical protein
VLKVTESVALPPTRDNILQTGFAFWISKVLLTAVEFGLFTTLGQRRLTGTEPGRELGPNTRASLVPRTDQVHCSGAKCSRRLSESLNGMTASRAGFGFGFSAGQRPCCQIDALDDLLMSYSRPMLRAATVVFNGGSYSAAATPQETVI